MLFVSTTVTGKPSIWLATSSTVWFVADRPELIVTNRARS